MDAWVVTSGTGVSAVFSSIDRVKAAYPNHRWEEIDGYWMGRDPSYARAGRDYEAERFTVDPGGVGMADASSSPGPERGERKR